MKKTLITGITGFAGSHLAEYLLSQKTYEISGVHATDRNLQNINEIKDKLTLIKADLNDPQKTLEIVEQTKPEIVFHLAASAEVGKSFEDPLKFLTNNSTSQLNILEAIKQINREIKIVIVSSAQVYGFVSKEDIPIDENTGFKPDSPYAVSKITQEYLALQYFYTYKLKTIILRPFNHMGPRLSTGLSMSRFAKNIVEIENGKAEPILTVGNLSAKRDFTDVEDMVRAYVLASEKCTPGEVYNIGTGVSHTIEELLNKLLSLSKVKISVKIDDALLRPSDNPELLADASKFTKATGWKPEIPIEKTLQKILDYWRGIV